MTTQIHVSRFPSPVGPLRLATVDDQLVHLDFDDNEERMHTLQNRRFRQHCDNAIQALRPRVACPRSP